MKKLFIRSQSEEMTLKELFEEFLIAKQCVNVSPFTIRFYEGCNRHFTDYIDEETPCSEITLQTVNGYILALKERGEINDITINTYLRGICTLLYYGMEIVRYKTLGKGGKRKKLIHLSNLHLGKRINEFPMLEDQESS